MSETTALTVSIGVLGAVAVWFTGAVLLVPVWVVFIAWASFAALGGGGTGWIRAAGSAVAGVVIASLAILASEAGGAGLVLTGVAVGLGSAAMVQASRVGLLVLPAIVWGFASTVGTTAVTGYAITATPPGNPAAIAAVALVLGACFGYAAERLAALLARPRPAARPTTGGPA